MSDDLTQAETVTQIQRVVDLRIVAEPRIKQYRWESMEQFAARLEGWVKDFHEFMRDHRSQDPVNLSVERVMQTQCSGCAREWEPVVEDGKTYCANCGSEES